MTRQQKNRIRGLILLTVFSLNTVVGFACSLGINMGYNKSHHQHEASHSHKKPHTHKESHHHEHSPVSTQGVRAGSPASNDDCCTNGVADFIKLDKAVASGTVLQPPVFLIAFASQFILPIDSGVSLIDTSIYGSLRRWQYSTDDTDLRIVIQSFQI